jgi:NAD(P)H-flavin reductase
MAARADRLTASLLPRIARVRSRRRETHDTWSLALDAELACEPGQFNMLYAFGVGEIPVSVSSDAAAKEPLVHTIRAVGAVSEALAALRPGSALGLRGPFGTAWPLADAAGGDLVIVAGGLGLAPLRGAIRRALAERRRFGRIGVLYGTRSPTDILYRSELERWRRRLDVDVAVTVDHADRTWHGNVGVVTRLIGRAGFDPARATAFVCGPEIMMRCAASALEAAGIAPARIHVSLERNMKCAVGQCGHCQFAGTLICRDGVVMRYDRVRPFLTIREL